jgi:FeS assembly SUF system protein
MEGKPLEKDVRNEAPAETKPVDAPSHAPAAEAPPAADATLEVSGPNAPTIAASAIPQEELERLATDIIAALKTVFDPEIPADIYELGLIYKVDINDNRDVAVEMTLTAPGCPVAGEMPVWVENAVNGVAGVKGTKVTLTFDPPWDQSRMSDEARLALNMF